MDLAFLILIYTGAFSFAFLPRLQSAFMMVHFEEEILLFVLHIMV